MKIYKLGIASAVLLSCLSAVQAQDQSTAEITNLAIPVVRISPTVSTPPPPKITGFADVVRARFPLAIQFSDLGTGWRIIEWGNTYFTKGETTIINNEEYLVAYLAQPAARNSTRLETKDYIRVVTTGNRGGFEPDDRFALTLLRMSGILQAAIEGQTGLRSFSPEALSQESRGRQFNPPLDSSAYRQKLSLIYLGKIHEAVSAYNQMYLNVMPPLESAFAARQALLPFAENDAIFYQPGTTTPYKANPLFSERKREHLRGKGKLVLFYEAAPAADGMRAVLYYDGTTRRVDRDKWERLKKASGLE